MFSPQNLNSLSRLTWCRYLGLRRRTSNFVVSNTLMSCRCLSSKQPENIMNVFDRKAKRLQKDRTASLDDYEVYEYIKDEVGFRLADRVCDVKRKFDVAVDLGCGRGHVSKNIYSDMVEKLYQCELSHKVLLQSELSPEVPTFRVIADEEFFPFRDNSLDLVVSNLSLHWVNDLPGCFRQVFTALKNDGVFIGSLFGGSTLFELRVSLQLAELEREGGFAPHISPLTDVQDLGNLLNRAGYTMLTIDTDEMVIKYPSMFELMYDLKGMGENNCAWSRKSQLHRDTLIAAAAIYKEMYGSEDGIPATFHVIYFIGWKPDPSQPKAAQRGSGQVSIKDLDKLDQLTKQFEQVKDGGDPQKLDNIEKKTEKFSISIKTNRQKKVVNVNQFLKCHYQLPAVWCETRMVEIQG